mmetsp:Transcript_79272/g.229263  ORF Transcript_79272/g.229263 Transcript_79272/m.229263 type:complete len:256 (-) Transcript_79272:1983-2750(-)
MLVGRKQPVLERHNVERSPALGRIPALYDLQLLGSDVRRVPVEVGLRKDQGGNEANPEASRGERRKEGSHRTSVALPLVQVVSREPNPLHRVNAQRCGNRLQRQHDPAVHRVHEPLRRHDGRHYGVHVLPDMLEAEQLHEVPPQPGRRKLGAVAGQPWRVHRAVLQKAPTGELGGAADDYHETDQQRRGRGEVHRRGRVPLPGGARVVDRAHGRSANRRGHEHAAVALLGRRPTLEGRVRVPGRAGRHIEKGQGS